MREKLLGSLLVLLTASAGLLSSSSPTEAGATMGNFSSYGFVCGVNDPKTWEKGLPNDKTDQGRYDLDTIEKTHFVFEKSSNEAVNKLRLQKALHRAVDNGWQVVSFDGDQVLIYNPRVQLYDKGRR